MFSDADALLDECQLHLDAAIEVYVYNVDSDEVRVAVVVPTYQWGGDGCLGCGVGSGYLHQLPQSRTRVIPFKPSPAAKATGGDESPAPPATPPAPENAAKPPPEIPDGAFERGQSDFLAAA